MAFVAVFTRRAQDITASYANPEGGRLLARCVALCIRRRYVTHRHITPAAGDHTTNRRAGTARAACEPQAARDGVCITSRAVVKRRRKRSVQAAPRSASQGRFFAAGALCVPPHERRRGACGFCCKRRDGAVKIRGQKTEDREIPPRSAARRFWRVRWNTACILIVRILAVACNRVQQRPRVLADGFPRPDPLACR